MVFQFVSRLCAGRYGPSKSLFVVDQQCTPKMLHFVGHCHKLDLQKLRESSKQVDILHLHYFFFPFPYLTSKVVGSNIAILAKMTRNGM